MGPKPPRWSGDGLVTVSSGRSPDFAGFRAVEILRPAGGKQGEESFGTLELVTSDRDVLAAFKLDELNAVGFNAAFVDFVEGVMLVADHWLRNGAVSRLLNSIHHKYAGVLDPVKQYLRAVDVEQCRRPAMAV